MTGGASAFLCIVDDYSRECLATVVDTSLGRVRAVRELERLAIPASNAVRHSSQRPRNRTDKLRGAALGDAKGSRGTTWSRGKRVQNTFVESFNSKLRDECLN